jgi:AcrR family transcriptional regulator
MDEGVDFRVRVARQKRERMRARLLAATLDLYSSHDRPAAMVIDDIIRQAGVSRGAFYKYFASIDQIVVELGRDMADEMIRSMEQVLADLPDPTSRLAASPLIPLVRAAMQPRWAAFTSRVDYIDFLAPGSPVGDIVGGELLRARAAGIVTFASLDVAFDLIVGAVLEGTRRLAVQTSTVPATDHARELSGMILLALGVDRASISPAVDQAWAMLTKRRSDIPWWNSPVT